MHLVGLHSAIKMLAARVRLIQQLVQKMQSGELPFHHALARKVSSLLHSLPAMDSPEFSTEYLTDYNDTLLAIYLASMTKVGGIVFALYVPAVLVRAAHALEAVA